MKKGFLFTLGTLFIVLLILTLSILMFRNTLKSEERFSESGASGRLHDISVSVEEGIMKIFNSYSGSNIIITENEDGTIDVSFKENISRSREDWEEEFNERIAAFKDYVESQEPAVKISAEEIDRTMPWIILPHNIKYIRSWETGHVRIIIKPQTEEENFNSYNITVNTNDAEIDDVPKGTFKQGSFKFSVRAVDNFGNVFVQEESIGSEGENHIQIFLVEGNKIKVTVDNRELETWTNTDNTITLTTTIDHLEKTDEKVSVELLKGAVHVNFPELGMSKNSTIRTVQ